MFRQLVVQGGFGQNSFLLCTVTAESVIQVFHDTRGKFTDKRLLELVMRYRIQMQKENSPPIFFFFFFFFFFR